MKANNRSGILALIFAFVLIVKCLFFQYDVFHSFIISGILRNPLYGLSWWGLKIFFPLILASLIFFFRRNSWTIVITLFVDIWMLANMMYLRSNGILLNGYAISMASNLDGFWSSILVLWTWRDLIPFFMSALYVAIWYYLRKDEDFKRNTPLGFCVLAICLVFNQCSVAAMKKHQIISDGEESPRHIMCYYFINPYSFENRDAFIHLNNNFAYNEFSLLHASVFCMAEYVDVMQERGHPYEFTQSDQKILSQIISKSSDPIKHDRPLIVILIESLETWAIHPDIMPNLYNFTRTKGGYYIPNLYSQIKGGLSADGQMIVTTGLLPVNRGATCFRYQYNIFPSWVDRTQCSATILTHDIAVWNQSQMSQQYGFQEVTPGDVRDSVLFQRIVDAINEEKKTILGITVCSHVPFNYADKSKMKCPKDMPELMQKYVKCLNWTDEGIGVLLNQIDEVSALTNAFIVFTGDHSIFWPEIRNEFESYCKAYECNYAVSSAAIPCIIYNGICTAPMRVINESAYQMDIYPTILAITNNTNYYWKGFGVNMLDSNFNTQRSISPSQAYDMSDKLIRANYFQRIQQ